MRQGAFHLKKGTQVDFADSEAERTEIVWRKHLFADHTAGVDVKRSSLDRDDGCRVSGISCDTV
jgi:hypothetical protein